MAETTLRERSRARRRAAIERTALQLFAEQGYDATTVAQIAEAAEVSPRTVSLYFPAKLDLALSHTTAAARRLAEMVANRRDGEATLDTMIRWLQEEFRAHGETLAVQRAMVRASPMLRGAETVDIANAKATVTAAFAADLGRTPDDVVVALLGGALEGVVAALIQLEANEAAFEVALRMLRAAMRTAKAQETGRGSTTTRRRSTRRTKAAGRSLR